ncbi:hypothetical protein ABIF65_008360 [Bradyrhizobium japonicum]
MGEAEHHSVHDLLIGQRIGDRLTHLRIVEGRLGDVHADILHAVGERQRHDVELAVRLHLLKILVGQLVGDVGVAAFQQRAAVAGLRYHAPDHALDLRQGTADPILVALHDHFGAGGPLRHLVGARARGLLFCKLETPGVLLAGVLLHQLGIDDAGHDDREIGDRELVLLQEIDAHGVVVDHDELLRLGERARTHLEGREAADADGAVERPLHVLGGDGRAVVEFGVLAQPEGDRHVVDLHLLGELALELVAVVIGHAAGAGLHLVADQAVVAIPGDFIAGHVGADAVDVEIVRAAFRDDQQRLRARIGIGGGDHGRHRRKRRACGQSGHGLEEIAALHGKCSNAKVSGWNRESQGSFQRLTEP